MEKLPSGAQLSLVIGFAAMGERRLVHGKIRHALIKFVPKVGLILLPLLSTPEICMISEESHDAKNIARIMRPSSMQSATFPYAVQKNMLKESDFVQLRILSRLRLL